MPRLPYLFRNGTTCTCAACSAAPVPPINTICMCMDCVNLRVEGQAACDNPNCDYCRELMEEEHELAVASPGGVVPRATRCRFCGKPATASCGCCTLCGHPGSTCQCFTCSGCETRHASYQKCSRCGKCNLNAETNHGCCTCVMCDHCRQYLESDEAICISCRRCEACCRCSPNIGKFWGTPTKRYPRYLGVEIECGLKSFHRELTKTVKAWGSVFHDDGSLRAVPGCTHLTEICTAPARGDDFKKNILETCGKLKMAGGNVNSSCGLHVHVDVRDFTQEQIVSLVRAYTRVEQALYGLVSRSRRFGTYSQALTDCWTPESIRQIWQKATVEQKINDIDVLTYGNLSAAREAKSTRQKMGDRYRGLNLNAIPVHGTAEFRLHQGTVNPVKILMWSAICSAIVEYASKHTDAAVGELKGSPQKVLEQYVMGADPEGAKETIAWIELRRQYFIDDERRHRGQPPIRRPQKPRPDFGDVGAEGGELLRSE